MFKAKSSLQIAAGERCYQFICDPDAPLTEVIEVLKKISQDVQVILDEALAKAKDSEAQEAILEEALIEEVKE
mgnify:CR=1 FL=1